MNTDLMGLRQFLANNNFLNKQFLNYKRNMCSVQKIFKKILGSIKNKMYTTLSLIFFFHVIKT